MRSPSRCLVASLLILAALLPDPAAAGLGRAFARGASRGAERAFARGASRGVERSAARGATRGAGRSLARRGAGMGARSIPHGTRVLRRAPLRRVPTARAADRRLHRGAKLHPLARARTVRRAVTTRQARFEVRHGVRPYRHFAAAPARGRLPASPTFRARYGIPHRVSRVQTYHFPRGTPVLVNRAAGGSRYELRTPRGVPPSWRVADHRLAGPARR
jgi:hypothetical protein